jgi:hypothetical protein
MEHRSVQMRTNPADPNYYCHTVSWAVYAAGDAAACRAEAEALRLHAPKVFAGWDHRHEHMRQMRESLTRHIESLAEL